MAIIALIVIAINTSSVTVIIAVIGSIAATLANREREDVRTGDYEHRRTKGYFRYFRGGTWVSDSK